MVGQSVGEVEEEGSGREWGEVSGDGGIMEDRHVIDDGYTDVNTTPSRPTMRESGEARRLLLPVWASLSQSR